MLKNVLIFIEGKHILGSRVVKLRKITKKEIFEAKKNIRVGLYSITKSFGQYLRRASSARSQTDVRSALTYGINLTVELDFNVSLRISGCGGFSGV